MASLVCIHNMHPQVVQAVLEDFDVVVSVQLCDCASYVCCVLMRAHAQLHSSYMAPVLLFLLLLACAQPTYLPALA